MTDTELLRMAQGGDMVAWRSLYARCLPCVWRQAMALVGDYSITEDIVSETLLALVHSIPEFDVDSVELYSWLRGVVRHKVADFGRQQSKQNRLRAATQNGKSENNSITVSASVEAEDNRQQVLSVLDQLPDQQRCLLEWKHIDDLSVREIAERIGQTEKAVESVLYRARKSFRRLYELRDANEVSTGDRTGTLEKSL